MHGDLPGATTRDGATSSGARTARSSGASRPSSASSPRSARGDERRSREGYHAPSRRKNKEDEPDLGYFARQFDGHPERLKNMHFAFVRACCDGVRRASPFLADAITARRSLRRSGVRGGSAWTAALVRGSSTRTSSRARAAVFEVVLRRDDALPRELSWWSEKKYFSRASSTTSPPSSTAAPDKNLFAYTPLVTMLGPRHGARNAPRLRRAPPHLGDARRGRAPVVLHARQVLDGAPLRQGAHADNVRNSL